MILYEHSSSGNCLKARVMLDQVGASYERVVLDLFAGETRTPEHFARNPDGRIPVLELDSGEFIAESGAILLYLAEGSEYLPADPLLRAQIHAWMFFEQNQVEANLGVARFLALSGRAERVPEVFADRQRRGRDALATLERGLGDGELPGRERLLGRRPRALRLRARRRRRGRRPGRASPRVGVGRAGGGASRLRGAAGPDAAARPRPRDLDRRPGQLGGRLLAPARLGVRLDGIVGGLGDGGAVARRQLADGVVDRLPGPPRAGHQDPARTVSGAHEHVRGAGGAVEEAPLREPLLLAVDDRDALPAEHEEVLLEALRVVEAARLPRLEHADADPVVGEAVPATVERDGDRPAGAGDGRRIRHIDHEPTRHLPDPTPR